MRCFHLGQLNLQTQNKIPCHLLLFEMFINQGIIVCLLLFNSTNIQALEAFLQINGSEPLLGCKDPREAQGYSEE